MPWQGPVVPARDLAPNTRLVVRPVRCVAGFRTATVPRCSASVSGDAPEGLGQAGATGDTELGVGVLEVIVDRPYGQMEALCDLLAGHAGGGEPDNLAFTFR